MFYPAQLQPYSLSGGGAIAGATSVTLKSFQTIEGVDLTMADFGAVGYATLEPGNGTQEEQISFTGVVQNSNGSATLTGVKSVLFITPYTETSGLSKTHAGSTPFIISNTSGFYSQFPAKQNDETITGQWTFDNFPITPANSDASVTVKGVTKLSVAPAVPTDPIAVGVNDTTIFAPVAVGAPGLVFPFAGVTAPSGFLSCDGAEVSRVTYAALFAAISTTWGAGDGSTTFNLPDLRGSTIIGAGAGVQKYEFNSATDVVVGPTAFTLSATYSDDAIIFNSDPNLSYGTPIYFSSGTLPVQLSLNTVYYATLNPGSPAHYYRLATSRANLDAGIYIDFSNTSGWTGVLARVGHFINSDLQGGKEVVVSTAGTLPTGLSAGTYWTMKLDGPGVYLSTSYANAVAGTPVFITGAGSGVQTLTHTLTSRTLGKFGGEENHTLTESELASHRHSLTLATSSGSGIISGEYSSHSPISAAAAAIGLAGNDAPHNNMQPWTALHYIIKT